MADICPLLFELAGHDRLRILHQLDEEPMVVTRLSKKLDLAVQETSRHLSRLRKIGLVDRDTEGINNLNPYGKLVLELLPVLEFTFEHRDYFSTHSYQNIPSRFVQRLGDLRESRLTEDIVVGFHNVDRLLVETQEYILSITDQYLVSHAPLITDALNRGVRMKNIDAPFSLPPQDVPEEWGTPAFTGALNMAREDGTMEEKFFMEKFDIYLFMSEKEVAVVGLPLMDGKFDYLGFSSSDERMRNWCQDLFDYYWERSRPREEVLDEFQRWVVKTPGAGKALRAYGEGRGGELEDEIRNQFEEQGLARGNKLTFVGLVTYRHLSST
jgi:predicted transcriptional regulator